MTRSQHSYIANSLGGKNGALVIDLGSFTDITVNEVDNTAVLGVGNKLGDIALALNEYGRAIPHGRCSYVGLGGHSGRIFFMIAPITLMKND